MSSLASTDNINTHKQHNHQQNHNHNLTNGSIKHNIISSHNGQRSSYQKIDTDALEQLWLEIINKWNGVDDKELAIDLSYTNPIPNQLRSNAWFIISGARDLMHKNRNVYEFLIEKIPTSKQSIDQIDKDLPRTFKSQQLNNMYNPKLRRILIAYANLTPSIPYTQGMNYIAGFILKQYFENKPSVHIIDNDAYNAPNIDKTEEKKMNTNIKNGTSLHKNGHINGHKNGYKNGKNDNDMDKDKKIVNEYWFECIEEQSFWTFTAIMNQIGSLFGNELYGFHKCVECFTKIFNYHGPKDLVKHLNKENVYMTIMTSWYHTLFTHPKMNENMAKRIWDIFIIENMDFSIILKVSYLILIRHKIELIKMDFIEITEFCKSTRCFVFGGEDDHDLIERAGKLQLNELYLKPIRNLKYLQEEKKKEELEDNEINMVDTIWSYVKMVSMVSKHGFILTQPTKK